MKLSYCTRGWHDQGWQGLVSMARDYGFSGLELYGIYDPVFTGPGGPLTPAALSATVHELTGQGLNVCCIDALGNLADPSALDQVQQELSDCIRLAADLQAGGIRVRATAVAGMTDQEMDQAVIDSLEGAVKQAEQAGVMLLLESCGIYADTGRLRDVLNRFASDYLAAVWDVQHPYRLNGESPETTITNLGAYVRHVHVKDSYIDERGQLFSCLLGEGDLPMRDMMLALRSVNYDGFLSLELNPDAMAELGDPHIMLPHYVSRMKLYDDPSRNERFLYYNQAGTGRYVWKKDTLVDLTFPQVLDRMAEEFPDQYCFKFTTLDYTRTYSQFRDDVDEFARALVSLGVQPGDHVAVWATNLPQWFIAFWSVTKIGAVFVSMNTAYKIHEAEYLLRQSDSHTVIICEGYRDANYKQIISELCPELAGLTPGDALHAHRLPFLRRVITVGFSMPGALTWEQALQYASKTPLSVVQRRAAQVDIHDVANMQYTSGTTGFPKGVMLTHYNVVNNGKYIGDHMDLSTADRMMIQVPMFHCFGMVLSMTAAMTHGATMSPLPYFSPKSSLACINQERITTFNGVPTMFIAMMQHEDFAKTDFSYIRTGIMAGSNCPADLMRKATEVMNMKQIVSVYGQTESSPGCTMSSFDDPLDVRTDTVGSRFANVECRIVDPDTGEVCPIGVNGEFVVRGYNVMKGYYKMPSATASAIDAEGWLHTGDLACEDENGNFKITGRLKDMIIRGGENIYPKEIEEFIYTIPQVSDVQVIGVPDEQYGEEIMACVILKEGQSLTEAELKDQIRSHMARHKVPKYVRFMDAFPMNAAGKILKYKMREDAEAMLKEQGKL